MVGMAFGSELAADATFGGKKYAVIARRAGIMPMRGSTNGFAGMAASIRLVKRRLRRDTRFHVMVWDRAEFPLGRARYREEVANRAEAIARIRQLVTAIEAGQVPTDPNWRPPWSPK